MNLGDDQLMTAETPEARFHSMKDHDLLVQIAVKTEALEGHSREQNSHIEGLLERALRLEGAVNFGKWILGITFGSAGIVGIIVLYIANTNGM